MPEIETEQKETFSKLIDSPMDEFKAFMLMKDVGFVHSLSLMIETAFLQLVDIKNGYINEIAVCHDERKEEKLKESLEKVYAEIQVIEEKEIYLVDLEKELLKID